MSASYRLEIVLVDSSDDERPPAKVPRVHGQPFSGVPRPALPAATPATVAVLRAAPALAAAPGAAPTAAPPPHAAQTAPAQAAASRILGAAGSALAAAFAPSSDLSSAVLPDAALPDATPGLTSHTSPPGGDDKIHQGFRIPQVTKSQCSSARLYLKSEGSMRFLDKYLPVAVGEEEILNLIILLGFVPKDLPHRNTGNGNQGNIIQLIKTLQKAMNKVLGMRTKIGDFNSMAQVCAAINKALNILVLTGAGISTSLGIPDFRSSKGFYSKLGSLGLDDPQEVFDLEYFKEDPKIFYLIAHMILPPAAAYTPLHGFIRLLQDKGKLLRNYTQNIDNLELNVGILPEKLVQCHGLFATATCITCKYQTAGVNIYKQIREQEVPECPFCLKKRTKLLDLDDNRANIALYGVMKPDITFFGEALPTQFHNTIKRDVEACDLLLCIGTLLKVAPVLEIVHRVPSDVPQILINKDMVLHCEFDVNLLGYCDDVVTYLCKLLGVRDHGWRINHPDFDKIAALDLECVDIDSGVGIYEIRNPTAP